MILPEFIFRAVLMRGMRTVRQDTRFLDQLFRNLDQKSAAEMRKFIQENAVYVDINYPRESLKLPAIIILLRSENESQAFLGDSMGSDLPDELSYDAHEDSEFELLGGAASVSTMSGQGPIVFGPFQAASGTLNTLKIEERRWEIDRYRGRGHTVHLLQGTGVGQQRAIETNNQDTLMVSPNWQTPPGADTVFEIRLPAEEVIGEPRSVYSRDRAAQIERLGSLYALQYQVQIVGPNPELVVYLHAIVKLIFTLSRTFMEGQGIINFKMGATDFVPKAEYQPDNAYMRAVNVDFVYPFDVFTELEGLATSLRTVLEEMTEFKPPAGRGDKVILTDTLTTIDPA